MLRTLFFSMYSTSLILSNMLAKSSSLSLSPVFSLSSLQTEDQSLSQRPSWQISLPCNLLRLWLSRLAHEEPLVCQVKSLAHGQCDLLGQLVRDKHVASVDVRISFFGNEAEESLLSFVIGTVRYPGIRRDTTFSITKAILLTYEGGIGVGSSSILVPELPTHQLRQLALLWGFWFLPISSIARWILTF